MRRRGAKIVSMAGYVITVLSLAFVIIGAVGLVIESVPGLGRFLVVFGTETMVLGVILAFIGLMVRRI
jgi:hypothetical protein